MKSLFDLVAPIAIYHAADVCYENKAKHAIKELRLLAQHNGAEAEAHGFKPTESLNDYLDYVHPE